MGQLNSQAEDLGSAEKMSPSLGRLIAAWVRVVMGLALAGEGGVLFADARMHWAGYGAWVGIATMALGAVVGFSGLCGIYRQARGPSVPDQQGFPIAPEAAVPMLGALLVYKYRWITEEQLAEALERQSKQPFPRPRLGTILLDMGLLSVAQLEEALAYQRSLELRDPRAAVLDPAQDGEQEREQTPAAAR
jgi:uncharacterized protein (DUF433 family)